MDTFADYILNEEDLASKMEIVYYLSKKTKIFFDKSVIFKTELARLFLNYAKLDVDKNLVLTACLLCNVKKIDNAQDLDSIHTYAEKGAEYLLNLGFNKRFCKICSEVNRYNGNKTREKESDVLELVDQFGGMLLNRPEREGYKTEDALVLLKYRNLKDEYNRYIDLFSNFVNFMDQIHIKGITTMPAIQRLVKIYNESDSVINFIKEDIYTYEPKVDKEIEIKIDKMSAEMLENIKNPERPLFSEETAHRILGNIEKEVAEEKEKQENV